jgi:D-3-phosphoglycerate dehydrogenase
MALILVLTGRGSSGDGERPATNRIFGTDFPLNHCAIGRMKPVAYLVNTGRGAVVDEDGLAAALIAGRIAGAALDVFAAEPLPADSPLRQAPNLIMTPHAIGVSDEMYAEYMEQVADAIEQFSSGRCPNDAVNPEGFGRA